MIGPIAPADGFAGQRLDRLRPGGTLMACLNCQLRFRFPRPFKKELDGLYAAGAEWNWQTPVEMRTDWQRVRKVIVSRPDIKSVLDVGCFDGGLLNYLGPTYERLGIEIHPAAARRAESRGVTVIGSDFENALVQCSGAVDVTIAVDVIEHTLDPLDFLRKLRNTVKPGGLIVITSGDASAWSWRLMGSRYWYCTFGEHLSFINPRWSAWAASALNLEIEYIESFSHAGEHASAAQRVLYFLKNIAYKVAPWLAGWLRGSGLGGKDVGTHPELRLSPPPWPTARDHLLVAFKRA